MPLRTEPFFKKMEYEKVDTVADGKSVLVSLEVSHNIDSGTLWATAEKVNAPYLYRITPVVPLGKIKTLAQAKAAVEDMDAAFRSLRTEHQSAIIHLVTTAPVALLVELGLRLRSNVYGGEIFIHHYDSNSMWYYPILNVMTQQVYSPE